MIFPEPMELMNPQGMNDGNVVQDGEHNSADIYNQKMKMLKKQTAFTIMQMPQAPDQNGVVLSPKELGSQAPCDFHAHHHLIRTRMTHLIGAFSARAQLFLSKIQRPPTPTQSSTSINSSNAVSVQNLRPKRIGSAEPSGETSCVDCMTCTKTLDPQSRAYLCWLVLVSLCFVYNCWAIPLRSSFPKHTLTFWDPKLRWSAMNYPPTDPLMDIFPIGTDGTVATEPSSKVLQSSGDKISTLANFDVGHQIKHEGSHVETSDSPLASQMKTESPFLSSDSHFKKSMAEGIAHAGKGTALPARNVTRSEAPPVSPGVTSTPRDGLSPDASPMNDSTKEALNVNMMTPTWLTLDVFADVIYLLDVIFVQPRVSFLTDHGIWAQEMSTTVQSYTKGRRSKMDIIALLPLDIIFYFVDNGKDHAYLRLPRVLKAGTFWEMCERLDVALASPHVVRIARTVASMLYLVHLHACMYYLFSTWEGIASNGWVFSGRGNAYIRCFYFATKTSTSIGKNPKPVNEAEYLFMTWSWLSGVFIFAMLIGQIKDIVATASKTRSEFQRLLDETIHYMRRIHLPENTQKRVFQWLTHTWEHQQVLDEMEVLEWLPSKLRGDVALDVHEVSLSKVHLFRHCGHQLLRQLVLKLRPVLYLPGDYVCRKGEVGKEMYIIKAGIVEVVGAKKAGSEGIEVLATLTEGSVFGEISLLDIGGGNKRTADVRSKGFSTLFVLSKADLREALEHHPEAKQVLKDKASQLMRENADREKKMKMEEKVVDMVIIKPDPNRPPTPKLIDTVIQAVGANSKAAQLLIYGSKAVNWENNDSAADHANFTHNNNVTANQHEHGGNSEPWTEPREHKVFGEINPMPDVDEVAGRTRHMTHVPDPHEITENDVGAGLSDPGDGVVSVPSGRNKFSGKKNGARNVFEGDVTVHQRMG